MSSAQPAKKSAAPELAPQHLNPKSDIETQSAALADGIGYWSANGHVWALSASKQLWSYTDTIAARHPISGFLVPPSPA